MSPAGRLSFSKAPPQALMRCRSPSPTYPRDAADTSSVSSWTHVPLLPLSSNPAKAAFDNDEYGLKSYQVRELESCSALSSSWPIISVAPKDTDTGSKCSTSSQPLGLDELTSPSPYASVTEATEAFEDDEDGFKIM
ncbi:hypothetical protein NP233_g13044 [Leucocoprinus birnbaumii]|uniref:Uncharacterized protein n=1 Tax=Leucocoprinus birnbaumii TaxID=56174 RepID=A0AAD5VDD4_9AGAR|nr:hypothetical protein NP233_g13044 [Leucocoprinus birnbaumii]